jgi:hypothetical protein
VLPQLREFLDAAPALWKEYGDLALHAEASLGMLAVGENLYLGECLHRKLDDMKHELAGPSPSPLDRLLAERVVACWAEVAYFDALWAQQIKNSTPPQAKYLLRQQESAQRRYLAAMRTLAMLQRLLPPRPKQQARGRVRLGSLRFSGGQHNADCLNGAGVSN